MEERLFLFELARAIRSHHLSRFLFLHEEVGQWHGNLLGIDDGGQRMCRQKYGLGC